MIYVLDTHTIIWFIEGNPRLSSTVEDILKEAAEQLILPAIVLAEAKYIITRGRTRTRFEDILARIDSEPRIGVVPVDRNTVERMPPSMEIHDAIICATALAIQENIGEEVVVLTRDARIRESGLVNVVW